jgi:plasmid stabilization system protein ParE
MIGRILGATERLSEFPESGRRVPEFERSDLREVILRPYRIVYRLVGREQVDVIAVHHGARLIPPGT